MWSLSLFKVYVLFNSFLFTQKKNSNVQSLLVQNPKCAHDLQILRLSLLLVVLKVYPVVPRLM